MRAVYVFHNILRTKIRKKLLIVTVTEFTLHVLLVFFLIRKKLLIVTVTENTLHVLLVL